MKRFLAFLVVVVCLLGVSAMAQSLGDIARKSRAEKKANASAKVIDNDVLPSSSSSAPAADQKDSTAASGDQKDSSADAAKPEGDKESNKKSAADQDKANIEAWKKQIAEQKKEITQLQRELDVDEREARLRAAAFYADAGVMLRDQAKFAEDTRKSQAEIDGKKQVIADAKQKLDDLLEQARKAGVPSGQLD